MLTQSGTCNRPKAINDAKHYLITVNTTILHTKKRKVDVFSNNNTAISCIEGNEVPLCNV
jgi:hypothetical protein